MCVYWAKRMVKSLLISKNFVKQDGMIKSSIASCYRVKNKNEFFALSTYNGFLPSWYKKPTDPLWDRICFFAFSQAIRVSQAFSGYQLSATTWTQCPWSCWWRSLIWRFSQGRQGGLGELRDGFSLLSIRNRQRSGFVSDSWWKREPWDCHVLSLLCFKMSVCCFRAFMFKKLSGARKDKEAHKD